MEIADFEIISTLRFDPLRIPGLGSEDPEFPFVRNTYMLEYHRDRMLAAAEDLNWSTAQSTLASEEGLTRFKSEIGKHLMKDDGSLPNAPLKVIYLLSKDTLPVEKGLSREKSNALCLFSRVYWV